VSKLLPHSAISWILFQAVFETFFWTPLRFSHSASDNHVRVLFLLLNNPLSNILLRSSFSPTEVHFPFRLIQVNFRPRRPCGKSGRFRRVRHLSWKCQSATFGLCCICPLRLNTLWSSIYFISTRPPSPLSPISFAAFQQFSRPSELDPFYTLISPPPLPRLVIPPYPQHFNRIYFVHRSLLTSWFHGIEFFLFLRSLLYFWKILLFLLSLPDPPPSAL